MAQEPGRLAGALHALSLTLAAARQSGTLVNPWQLAGLKRAEVRNATVLAGFWTPARCGSIAADFLNEFFGLIDLTGELYLPFVADPGRTYAVRVEDSPLGLSSERVDLTIEGEALCGARGFLVGVEIKIGAAEGHKQLARYVTTISRRARDRKLDSYVILLASFPCTEPGVISANWKQLALAARTVARKHRTTINGHLLGAFAEHVSSF